jgi:hypothetical protein
MSRIYEKVGLRRPRYSAFDLSHEVKLTCKMGDLIPILVQEVVPGDNFRINTETLIRMAPMLAPVMHRLDCFIHYFYVPNRIVWPEWDDFWTGGESGNAAPVYPVLDIPTAYRGVGSLADYMGIPTSGEGGDSAGEEPSVSALPFGAYQMIYNEYYRDQNLTGKIQIPSQNDQDYLEIRKRAWQKDYFTSALPFTQRGPSGSVPIQSSVDEALVTATGLPRPVAADLRAESNGDITAGANPMTLTGTEGSMDINDLRTASAIQRFAELMARVGARPIEALLGVFGVKSSDSRLQRPEYIGGGKTPIVISEVLNTSATATEPQGNMSGHGVSAGNTNYAKIYVKEHGYIMGIMSVLPKTAYQQGINRTFLRRDRYDYYLPQFANLGEQAIKKQELYFSELDPQGNQEDWGFQQRYAEYKYAQDRVAGDFRTTLNFWHEGRIFPQDGVIPPLNTAFVEADPSTRIFAEQSTDHIWCQLYHSIKARRPMPYFADPRLS